MVITLKLIERYRAGGEPACSRAEPGGSRQDSSSGPAGAQAAQQEEFLYTFFQMLQNKLKFDEPIFAFHCLLLLKAWKETPLSHTMPGTPWLQHKHFCFFPFFLPASPFPPSKVLVY